MHFPLQRSQGELVIADVQTCPVSFPVLPGHTAAMGTGTACVLAMNGLDIALWDIRAKAVDRPLYRLLGGASKPLPTYAGGVALDWQAPEALAQEAQNHVEHGYKALKLRLGGNVAKDLARAEAVRRQLGDGMTSPADVNTAYPLNDAKRAMPALDALGIGWLEEPSTPHVWRSYHKARQFATLPLATGENHYTHFDFARLIDKGSVDILQPDLSKNGSITETLKSASTASAHQLPMPPHTSMTGINMAATLHVLAAIEGNGYFEADISCGNLFLDELANTPFALDANGCVRPREAPSIGIKANENFIHAHPAIEGPAYA